MNLARIVFFGGLVAATPVWAVYAPVPEQEQGKEWTVTLRGDISHDDNIFGAQTGAVSSMVYQAAPRIAFNASVTDQTFVSAAYALTLDHFTDRPGDQTLDSHLFSGRIAHAFSSATTLDVSEDYAIVKNPESLLAGLALNTDQSYRHNEFNGRLTTSLAPKLGTTVKARSVLYRYDSASLATSLDRTENLYGLAGSYDLAPEMKGVVEYRREDVRYRTAGANKDKHSNFLMGGVDYAVAKRLTASVRLGNQWRQRDLERSLSMPYAELSGKYDYASGSFLSGGYVYTLEETSNIARYTDTKVNRFFVNLQHALTPLIAASGSFTYEPSELQGRRGLANADETTTRVGLALSYLLSKNWMFSAHYDRDHVTSDDVSRGQQRARVGVGASYVF
ncbi:MAG: outer membrane beta-barrel protein [Opitutales bacterium]|nr:outer membrane beta-barrel protein [Opitutales bacterium]